MRNLTDQEIVRREKATKIKELGIDPFGSRYDRTAYSEDLKEKYKDIPHDDFENINDCYKVAGRIMFIRKMGKASFFTIQDKKVKSKFIFLLMMLEKKPIIYLNQLTLAI